jgi:hypothetical protein
VLVGTVERGVACVCQSLLVVVVVVIAVGVAAGVVEEEKMYVAVAVAVAVVAAVVAAIVVGKAIEKNQAGANGHCCSWPIAILFGRRWGWVAVVFACGNHVVLGLFAGSFFLCGAATTGVFA